VTTALIQSNTLPVSDELASHAAYEADEVHIFLTVHVLGRISTFDALLSAVVKPLMIDRACAVPCMRLLSEDTGLFALGKPVCNLISTPPKLPPDEPR
jgi:hypothetical protein